MIKLIKVLLLGLFLLMMLSSCNGSAVQVNNDTDETTSVPDTVETKKGTDDTTDTAIETDVTIPVDTYSFPTDPLLYVPAEEENYGTIDTPDKSPAPFAMEGTLRTATGTSLNIIIEYEIERAAGEDQATLTLDLAIEHKAIYSRNFIGKLMIDGSEHIFMSPFYDYSSSKLAHEWLCPVEMQIPCGYGESKYIDIAVEWEFEGKYEGRDFKGIRLDATLPIGEKYDNLKPAVKYPLENILQEPELPEGCEVTSLAIILRHLGFDITHTDLADNYLEQGPVGSTNFYEMNLGNPRNKGKSWGCYSPVIVKTANKYLADMKSYYRAFSYTGYDIHELYYQLSLGHPAIVWVTMNFAEPYINKPWTVNGEKLYWKYPLHCVVLSGYDMENRTVTITDPLKNKPVTVDMEKFELRYKQMESQAVVIKMSKEK